MNKLTLKQGQLLRCKDDFHMNFYSNCILLILYINEQNLGVLNISIPVKKISVQEVFGIDFPHPIYCGGSTFSKIWHYLTTVDSIEHSFEISKGLYAITQPPLFFFNTKKENCFNNKNLRFYQGYDLVNYQTINEMIENKAIDIIPNPSFDQIFWS